MKPKELQEYPEIDIREDGSIYLKKYQRLAKLTTVPSGYKIIRLRGRNVYVHRLVATRYLPNPKNKPTVNHKDSDKGNNAVSNLEWATYTENELHSFRNGRTVVAGSRNGNAKINEADVMKIKHLYNLGHYQKEIAKLFGLKQQQISRIVNGVRWAHLTKRGIRL